MKDNTSTMLLNLWLLISGVFGALNLRSIVNAARKRQAIESELKAKETKIIMLEAKILYLESKLDHDNTTN